MWVKPATPETNGQRDWILYKGNSFWLNRYQNETYNFGIYTDVGGGTDYEIATSNQNHTDTTWHHIVGVWNGTNV